MIQRAIAVGAALCVSSSAFALRPQEAIDENASTPEWDAVARVDEIHHQRAREVIDRAIGYLRSTQDRTGGWSRNPDGPDLPAVTALVITGMLLDDGIDSRDPHVAKGVKYILSFRQPDDGIYDRILPNYNTSIALSALSLYDLPEKEEFIRKTQDYLRSLQWTGDKRDPNGEPITANHPFYGGVGYGNHGRPDNSNLNMMLQALHDSGVDPDDPAIQRAVKFLERTQMLDSANDMPYADGSEQGGFIYATSENKDHIGSGESKAGMIVETLDDGTQVSRLRAYGSMTYAGFKSYVYADLERDDPRVQAAYDWIRRNYALDENPGVGMQGYYYYLLTFARALDAWGEPTISTLPNDDAKEGETRFWANELVDRLESLQREDGSFVNDEDRWMEGDPNLVTAYALIALQEAIHEE